MSTNAANELVFIIGGHVTNSRKANLKSSLVSDILFINSALRKKRSMLATRFHIFTLHVFSKTLLLTMKWTI